MRVANIDKNMTIKVELIDTATKKAVLTDTFSATGFKQFRIGEGKYELKVSIEKANGNSKYEISLLMPEVVTYEFLDKEVPLTEAPTEAPADTQTDAQTDAQTDTQTDAQTDAQTDTQAGTTIITYTVVSGDSLSRIAAKYLGDGARWREIYNMNKKVIGSNPDLIYPGQVFEIKK